MSKVDLKDKARVQEYLSWLEARVKELEGLIRVTNCPCCIDGSGAYHDSNGEPVQCQWCLTTDSIRNPQERTK